jgi:hypothetical protein
MANKTTETETTAVAPQPVIVNVPSDAEYERQRELDYQAAVDEGKRLKMDEAPEGGRFLLHGVLVDANGQPITE